MNRFIAQAASMRLSGNQAYSKFTDVPLKHIRTESIERAHDRIFGVYQNPEPGIKNGRSVLRNARKGPTLNLWYRPHLRSTPEFFYYKSLEERYALAKNAFFRSKGRAPPKKGAGKKALKRLADAKKAAAKAAKGK